MIQGGSIYWAVTRNNYGAGNATYPSVYVGTPVINPVWTEAGNLDPAAPSGEATCPGIFFDAVTSQIVIAYLGNDGGGPCRIIFSGNGFATSTASVLYDDSSGSKLFLVDAPLLIFSPSFTYMATGSAPEEGPIVASFFTPAAPLPSPLSLSCNNPPSGTVGVSYSHDLVASGGTPPYTFAITAGSLPNGLSLNTATGTISGTPTVAGTSPFTAQVTDADANTASVNCSIVIGAAPLTLGSVKITLRGVKLRCKPQDDPNFQQVPQLPGVKRAM